MPSSTSPPCVTARKDIRAIPKRPPPVKNFFPWDRIWKYFEEENRERLRRILSCSCDSCVSDAKLFDGFSKPIQYENEIIGELGSHPDWSRTSISLLALLISIEHPQFIIPFLQKNRNDSHLEVLTGEDAKETLQQDYWPDYAKNDPEGSDDIADQFVENLPKFALPRLDSPQYVAWGANRILPFLQEEEVGRRSESGSILPEGANSRVFTFEIYDEYRDFKVGITSCFSLSILRSIHQDHSSVTKFARKQISASRDLPPLLITLEKEALNRVGTLSHRNIIKLIKTYKLGENYNLVFPQAKTNLDKYLRDPALDAGQMNQRPIERSSLWKQLCGITEAVAAIHSFGEEAEKRDASEKEKLIGFHFDIKDANILIEEDGTWVITDFGQAIFKDIERDGTTSRVLNNQGGTDSYAPPELNDSKEKLGRSYDIYSLGCIFLEVLAFIVRGHEGLTQRDREKGLDESRRTRALPPRREDHRFYTEGDQRGTWKIKEEIVAFMDHLATCVEKLYQPRSHRLLTQVLALIRTMISPVAHDRPEAQKVLKLLKDYLEEATMDSSAAYQNFSLPEGTNEINKEEFSQISESGLHRRDGQRDEKVHLHLLRVEDQYWGTVELLNINKDRIERHTLSNRAALIPLFSFPKKPAYGGPAISFVQEDSTSQNRTGFFFKKVSALDYDFPGGDFPKQAKKMQSIMTGQHLSREYLITEVILTQLPESAATKIVRHAATIFSRHKDHIPVQSPSLNGKSAKVQLWREYESREGAIPRASTPVSKERRERARQVDREVPPCRVVLYCGRSIILLRIVQNERIKPSISRYASRTLDQQHLILEFAPTDKSRDESFMATIFHPPKLKADDESSYAAIPLDRDWLQELEENHGSHDINCITQEFISIKIRFQSQTGESYTLTFTVPCVNGVDAR